MNECLLYTWQRSDGWAEMLRELFKTKTRDSQELQGDELVRVLAERQLVGLFGRYFIISLNCRKHGPAVS